MMVNARAVIVIINSSEIVVLKNDITMDNRIKKLALEGLINRVSADPGAGLEPAYLLKKDFVDKVIEVIDSLNENVILYLSNDIKLPEVGSKFVMRQNGEDIESIVESINFADARITIAYPAISVYYFKTAEAASQYTTTGKKGTYPNWDDEQSEDYCHKGEYEITKHEFIGFNQL